METFELINQIFNTSLSNEKWVGAILDFLNDNNQNKYYSEYYLRPEGSYGTRKYTYRFISTEEDMPVSITDDDINVLKRFRAQTRFILFDYEEDPDLDVFDYLTNERTLKKCLESLGMTDELKEHLCEYCFNMVKSAKNIKHQKKCVVNEAISKPIVTERPSVSNTYRIAEPHKGFVEWQPISERYEVPGLMPRAPRKSREKDKNKVW